MMLFDIYSALYRDGIQVIPCLGKAPIVKAWKGPQLYEFKKEQFTGNIGIRCGKIQHGYIEGLDFDKKYGETFHLFEALVREIYPGLFDKLYVELTPSGGNHVLYVVSQQAVPQDGVAPPGNLKLAYWYDENKKKVCPIETRGDGGYLVVAPSTGYVKVQGDLLSLPVITQQQRDGLINICRSFNRVVKQPHKVSLSTAKTDGTIEKFNAEYDVVKLLEKHGWKVKGQSGETIYLIRPGSKSGEAHATYNHGGHRLLYIFSSNSEPFESDRGYTVFGVYSMIEHAGNNKEAFKEIVRLGYGTTPSITGQDHIAGGAAQIKQKDTLIIQATAYEYLINGIEISQIDIASLSCVMNGEVGYEQARQVFMQVYREKAAFFGFKKKTTQAQAEIMIVDRYKLFRNVVNNGLFYKNGSALLEKTNITEVWGNIGRLIDVRREVVKHLCELKSVTNEYDPFMEYFESLTWDGSDEIASLAGYIRVEEQEFHDQQLEKMFMRCIHCMLGKGENRFVWTYVGGQYIGKSYLLRFLCPPRLKEYYTEEKPTSDKDCTIRLQENGFYNWEELQSSTNFEINQMKAMISKAINKIRRPYGTEENTAVRRANFFASTNEDSFLTDDENTRWLPFKIISIDPSYSANINIDKCWAQAYHKYKAGFDFNISKEEINIQHSITDKYRFMTAEEEMIVTYFKKIDPNFMSLEEQTQGVYLTAIDIMNKLNVITSKGIKLTKERVGRVLSRKGYAKKRDSTGVFKYLVMDESRADTIQGSPPANRYETETTKEDLPF